MGERCAQCTKEIEQHLSFETPRGDPVCAACYFAVWGPSGAAEISLEAERLTRGMQADSLSGIRMVD